MKPIENFTAYVHQHRIRDIMLGQSGAVVSELTDNRIAKHIQRNKLQSDDLWARYTHEATFYQHTGDMNLPFLPQVQYIGCTDSELLLILKKYRAIQRSDITETLLEQVASTLVKIHTLPVPDFFPHPEPKPPLYTDDAIAQYVRGWTDVLSEHGNSFQADALEDIAQSINLINTKFASTQQCLTHGDFHFDNLLMDNNGQVIVCDWQCCGCGDPSGDLSFFISRLLADGVAIDPSQLVNTYCKHANQLGLAIQPSDVHTQMCLANLNTSFMFWHNYLHNATAERVGDIYNKMVADHQYLENQ